LSHQHGVDDHPLLATSATKQPLPPTPLAAAALHARTAANALAAAAASAANNSNSQTSASSSTTATTKGNSGSSSSSSSKGNNSGGGMSAAAAATAAAVAEAAATRAEAAARAELQGNSALAEDPLKVRPCFSAGEYRTSLAFRVTFLCLHSLLVFAYWLHHRHHHHRKVAESSDLFSTNGLKRAHRVVDEGFTPALRALAFGGLPPSVNNHRNNNFSLLETFECLHFCPHATSS